MLVRFVTSRAAETALSVSSTAIFNKRLVALLLLSCINGRQSRHLLPVPRGTISQLKPRRRRLILDGLVSYFVPPRQKRDEPKRARSI